MAACSFSPYYSLSPRQLFSRRTVPHICRRWQMWDFDFDHRGELQQARRLFLRAGLPLQIRGGAMRFPIGTLGHEIIH
jgi:hypothetical protein